MKKNENIIKKYPVFYQGEEYEIRIENPYKYIVVEEIIIYKVTKYKNWFGKDKISYEKVYSISIDLLKSYNKYLYYFDDNDCYYIKLFKKAFDYYKCSIKLEKEKEIKQEKRLAALEKWDGVINE